LSEHRADFSQVLESKYFPTIPFPTHFLTFSLIMGKDHKKNKKVDATKENSFIVKNRPRSNNLQDAMAWAAAQEVAQ
jgi:hypothetical protein